MNSDEIVVSVIATAHRPKNWEVVFNSIVSNLNFEVIFVGPKPLPRKVNLPDNFRFIKSKVKPTQCVEIAMGAALGKFILLIADDLVFETKYALDILVESWMKLKNDYAISSCKYKLHGVYQSEKDLRYFAGDLSTPLLPIGGLMLRSAVFEIGAVDNGFIGVFYDIDLVMRLYERGGVLKINEVFLDEKVGLRRGSTLCGDYWKSDREYLNSLWTFEGKVVSGRNKKVSKFKSEKILTFTQGPRGHWAGRTSLIDFFMDLNFWSRKLLQKLIITKIAQQLISTFKLRELRSFLQSSRNKGNF